MIWAIGMVRSGYPKVDCWTAWEINGEGNQFDYF